MDFSDVSDGRSPRFAAARGAAAAVRGLGAFLFSRPGYRKKARRAASS